MTKTRIEPATLTRLAPRLLAAAVPTVSGVSSNVERNVAN
jgi:hypothetical protein